MQPFYGLSRRAAFCCHYKLRRLLQKPAARQAFSLACGHRGRLHGLDALPPTARLGPGCPAAPRCARASAFYVRVPRTANRTGKPGAAGSSNALARPQAGAGVLAPPQDLPRLGPLSAEASQALRHPLRH